MLPFRTWRSRNKHPCKSKNSSGKQQENTEAFPYIFEILSVLSRISLHQRGSKVNLTEYLAGKYWNKLGLFKENFGRKKANKEFKSEQMPDEKYN